jgi:diguanylate cyclase (GGDEF)-like protein
VALFDLDAFKAYNDNYGHQGGDHVLVRFAQVLRAEVRRADFVYRYGGEEFLVVFTEEDAGEALRAIGRVMARVRALAIPHVAGTAAGIVTASAGLAPATKERGGFALAVRAADRALYAAKADGRNRVGVCRDVDAEPTVVEWGPVA